LRLRGTPKLSILWWNLASEN